jgi:hypothetical protein
MSRGTTRRNEKKKKERENNPMKAKEILRRANETRRKTTRKKAAISLVFEYEVRVTPNINNPDRIINTHVYFVFEEKFTISLANKIFKPF